MSHQISSGEYRSSFGITGASQSARDLQRAALEHALDIRKFEIQLYWTRATYFWAFIAAALAAYGAIMTVENPEQKTDLSVFLSCIGFVLSFGWYCANRGSKHWQENWENHVDLLENEVVGPLYKTILSRPDPRTKVAKLKSFVTGPRPFSVSKINQIISLYISVVWLLLLSALPPLSINASFSIKYTVAVSLATLATVTIWCWGQTQKGDFGPAATKRDGSIEEPKPPAETVSSMEEICGSKQRIERDLDP